MKSREEQKWRSDSNYVRTTTKVKLRSNKWSQSQTNKHKQEINVSCAAPLCVVLSFFPMGKEEREGAALGTILLYYLGSNLWLDHCSAMKNSLIWKIFQVGLNFSTFLKVFTFRIKNLISSNSFRQLTGIFFGKKIKNINIRNSNASRGDTTPSSFNLEPVRWLDKQKLV